MTIKKLWKQPEARLNINICLESLGLIRISEKYYCVKKSSASHIIIKQSKLNFTPIFSNLYIVWNIFKLSKQEKQQIIYILCYCSGVNSSYRRDKSQNARKYLKRFRYRYGKQFISTFKFVTNNDDRKLGQDCAAATIALYTIYKVLKVNNEFSEYRKFKKHNTC